MFCTDHQLEEKTGDANLFDQCICYVSRYKTKIDIFTVSYQV